MVRRKPPHSGRQFTQSMNPKKCIVTRNSMSLNTTSKMACLPDWDVRIPTEGSCSERAHSKPQAQQFKAASPSRCDIFEKQNLHLLHDPACFSHQGYQKP